MNYIGLDIGSTNAKFVVLDEKENIKNVFVTKTGFSSKVVAEILLQKIQDLGYKKDEMRIVATGYGRVSVPEAMKTVTEITCHARGAMKIFNTNDIVIIDIGGQDTKIINVEDGQVKDFLMNDKCSAGTGRFLDVMAKTMETDINNLVDMAQYGQGVTISSLCTVFAESEIITLIGRAEKKENIANAIVNSIITKISSQVSKIDYKQKQVCLTGGLCDLKVFIKMMSDVLKVEVLSNELGRYAGAIGAAVIAKKM